MKSKIFIPFVALALILSAANVQAQNKNKTGNKGKTAKPTKPVKQEPENIELPANSNDCLFAIQLQPDVPFGPTTAPQGAGRIQEIMKDKSKTNVSEYE